MIPALIEAVIAARVALRVAAPLGVPVQPDREGARALAVEELAKREYQVQQPSLWARILNWITDRLNDLHVSGGPGPALLTGLVAVLVGALIAYVLWRAGGAGRRVRAGGDAVFAADVPRSAAEHRAAAQQAADGDWRTAVLERFRALVRDLEDRTVLVPQPGRTAAEAARRDAGTALPVYAEALLAAARLFDDVRYGDRPASRDAYERMASVDEGVRTAPMAVR